MTGNKIKGCDRYGYTMQCPLEGKFWLNCEEYSERETAPHSSTLAWKIPWMEEPVRLQSIGSLRVGHDFTFTFTFHFHALEKEMATHSSVLAWRIPGMGEPGGLPSMGSHRVGHGWSDLAYRSMRNTFRKHLVVVISPGMASSGSCLAQGHALFWYDTYTMTNGSRNIEPPWPNSEQLWGAILVPETHIIIGQFYYQTV